MGPRCGCPLNNTANFAIPGGKRIFCSRCRPPEAIDVVHKKCVCGAAQPIFGFHGDKATCCRDCKEPGMVDVKNPKCECGATQPSIGIPGERPRWCGSCPNRQEGARNVIAKRCVCTKFIPIFGYPEDELARWCSECRPEDTVDIANPMCKKCGVRRPSFGFRGDKMPSWCFDCKENDAIDIKSKHCPGYNGIECPVRCRLMSGREYCLSCDPDESRKLLRKKDEHAFFSFLEKNDFDITCREYRIDYVCIDTSRKYSKIDGMVITPNVVVCIELDEDEHEFYKCDEARMHDASAEVMLAFPDRPISWIRVNPNTKTKTGKRDRSAKAIKIRDERHEETLIALRDLVDNPRTCIKYVGYSLR
jgi:hypothetical protein